MFQKRNPAGNLARDKRFADEDRLGFFRVDSFISNRAAFHNGQTEKRHLFQGDHLPAVFLPVSGGIGIAAVVSAQLFQPLAFDIGDTAGEDPRGQADFRRHNPLPRFIEQAGAGIDHHLSAFGRIVKVFLFLPGNVGKITA